MFFLFPRGEERPPDVAFHRFPDIFDADRKPIDERGRSFVIEKNTQGRRQGEREDPSGTRTSVLRSRSGYPADYVFVRSADIRSDR